MSEAVIFYVVALFASLGTLVGVLRYLYMVGFFNAAYLYVIRTRAEVSLIVTGFLAFRVPSSL